MLETILTLSDTKNHPFNEQTDFFKNHNPFLAQVSTPAWGYNVVTNFRCTPKRVIQYLVHNARKLYCASLFGTIRKINLKKGWNNHGILNAKNTLGLMGSRPKVARDFGLGPFLKLSFRIVPNELAQYNFRAL